MHFKIFKYLIFLPGRRRPSTREGVAGSVDARAGTPTPVGGGGEQAEARRRGGQDASVYAGSATHERFGTGTGTTGGGGAAKTLARGTTTPSATRTGTGPGGENPPTGSGCKGGTGGKGGTAENQVGEKFWNS